MPLMTRRRFLQIGGLSSLALGLPLRLARAGRSRVKAAQANAATARYRYQRDRLFQPIPAASSAAPLGGPGFDWRIFGATHNYVDLGTGWHWDEPGSDWIDRTGQRYGTQPWFNMPSGTPGAPPTTYTVDVTQAVQYVQTRQRWNAWLWKPVNAPHTIAGTHHATHPRPVLHVQYDDGSSADLLCTFTASIQGNTELCASAAPQHALPALIEFDRPARAVVSAQLRITVVEHWSPSGGPPSIQGFLLDPPVNAAPVVQGLAAAHGLLDAGLQTNAQIFGVHRYLDGTSWSDFSVTTPINTGAERDYDPAIYGNGPTDTTKLPHRGLGKWINAIDGFSLVRSDYAGEGFAALTPGLGAMRVVMPAEPGLQHGSILQNSNGTLASAAKLFLPEPVFGRLKRMFVRYYMRLGTPYVTPNAKRYHVRYVEGGTPVWTNLSGKIGITPSHDTFEGGVSGSSGGGYGWQMRLSWFDCDAEMQGPNENALAIGLHTFDFQANNPPGHWYGQSDKARQVMFGQRGGLASVLYPGRWYCIEMEVDLNTVMAGAPGYLADGAVRIWLDGRLGYERTGMVMRSLPLVDLPYNELKTRSVREIGHRDLWFNWFHGGKTKNSIDRTVFITGLAWARSYIGPMRMPSGDPIFADDFDND
jgi:hypothetical protein